MILFFSYLLEMFGQNVCLQENLEKSTKNESSCRTIHSLKEQNSIFRVQPANLLRCVTPFNSESSYVRTMSTKQLLVVRAQLCRNVCNMVLDISIVDPKTATQSKFVIKQWQGRSNICWPTLSSYCCQNQKWLQTDHFQWLRSPSWAQTGKLQSIKVKNIDSKKNTNFKKENAR